MLRMLLRYGKEAILMDATHKVLRYRRPSDTQYPQFILAVPTNNGYQVIMNYDYEYESIILLLSF